MNKEQMTLDEVRNIEKQAWIAYRHSNYECFKTLISFVQRRYKELQTLRCDLQIDTRLTDSQLQPTWVFNYRQADKTVEQDAGCFYHIPTYRIIADYTDFFPSWQEDPFHYDLARKQFLIDFPEFERRI